MSALTESGSPKGGLYCELCDDIQFLTHTEWQIHHLHHLRQPFVQLVKLNTSLCQKLLQGKSYRVNTGVARSSQHHLPPLKISFIKRGGTQFTVKKEQIPKDFNSPKSNDADTEGDSRGSGEELTSKPVYEGPSEVEGKELLERLGASFSISRKVKSSDPNAKKPESTDAAQNAGASSVDVKKDNILERLSGIGGISISSVSKSSSPEAKPTCGVSISSKRKSLELSELKLLKDKFLENEKKPADKNKILEKLTVSGLIPKAGAREVEKDCKGENKIKVKNEETLKGDPLERSRSKSNKSDDSNDSTDSKVSGESRTSQVNANEENGKTANENTGGEQKKFVRVKRSSFKKSMRPRREGSSEEPPEEKTASEEGKEKDSSAGETGIVILERLTENLSNTVGAEKSAEAANSSQSNSTAAEDPLAIGAGIGELNSDVHAAAEPECSQAPESQFQVAGEKNLQEQEQVEMLLTSPMNEQNGKSSSYSGQNQPEPYGEPLDVSDGNNEANENPVSFTSLSNENQSEEPGEQQTAFWSDIQNSSNNDNQPQEDPLLTPDNPVPDGDSNFLHSFSSEYQPPSGSLPPENSEFMSLDRLGHSQHRQSPYGSDPTSPMEHLNQQVQRLPNPTPQINVISPHHLQAPHAGVPQPPQQPNPQQLLLGGNDALHMQPPLPPPLYQGYMYNQNYPPQPQIPRAPQPQMPMLQQRPTIPTRAFQPMPVPQQRPRSRPTMKRKIIRVPPQDVLSTPKQPRMNSSPQMRPQVPNVVAKSPSGTTVSHPKALEASKVANVLASRGITVTPSRQTSQATRPQQQRLQSGSSSSVRNLGSAVSIASSNQNRNSGGFAVPSPRRSAPIVNHNAERPERCMTVDLTQDEELPTSQLRNIPAPGRFPCQVCGKVFGSSTSLRAHKNYHSNALAFKCDLCSMQFNTMAYLMNHRQTCHKKAPAPDLAIPIVDLNHPGARDQLRKCGVFNFIPLAQLQSNNNGYFGVPIIQLDTAKEKAVSNLSLLGAGNILVLGKMKAITPQTGR